MMEKFSHLTRVLLLLLVTAGGLVLGDAVGAQKQPPATSAVSTSCDGALDIVPSKPVTFARKRRPARNNKSAPADAKPERKSPSEGKQSL